MQEQHDDEWDHNEILTRVQVVREIRRAKVDYIKGDTVIVLVLRHDQPTPRAFLRLVALRGVLAAVDFVLELNK